MSRLGDLIIEHGPYDGVTPPLSVRSYAMQTDELNELRAELIELRAAAPPPAQCEAETRSWDHFTPEQMDSYWIRCMLSGPHDEHEDENTGLTWKDQASGEGVAP